jgi:hypothetical protein
MRQVTVPADVSVQLAGNTAVLRVVRRGVPVKDAIMFHEKFGGGNRPRTDEHGELRLLRERAVVQRFAIKTRDGASVQVELPLDTAPDRPIVIDVGDIERAPVTFDVTSAIEVQQFGAIWRAATASGSNGATVARVDGQYRCEVAPGDYRLWIQSSNRGEGNDRFVMPQTLQLLVPRGGTRMALTLHHGGRIRLQVRDTGGVHLAGNLTLVGPDGVASKPGLDGADGYYLSDGKLPGNGPVETSVLAPGTWQLALDLGRFGIHRRTVEVRACMVAEVDVTVQ